MHGDSYVRSRSSMKRYARYTKRHAKSTNCAFCELVNHATSQVVAVRPHCLIIKNRYSYDTWDNYGVVDHFMVIPKRHVTAIGDLTQQEQRDYMAALVEYEALGYSLYARAPGNSGKTIAHQHTHLIKIDDKQKKFMLYVETPFIRITR